MDREQVEECFSFADRRLAELSSLNGGDLPGAVPGERQILFKEFFFHLTSSIDYLAQAINQTLALGIDPQEVSVGKVEQLLTTASGIASALRTLHPPTRGQPLPSDPYGDEGLIFRAFVYRNQAAHARRNPFHFRMPSRETNLFLDPRQPGGDPSDQPCQEELKSMNQLFRARCAALCSAAGI